MRTRHLVFDIDPMQVPEVRQRYEMIAKYAQRYIDHARYNGESVREFVEQASIDVFPAKERGFAHARSSFRQDLRSEIARLDRRERKVPIRSHVLPERQES